MAKRGFSKVPAAGALIAAALAAAAAAPFERIVALTPSSVEIIYALGAEDRLVAVSAYADYPPRAREEKPSAGGIVNPDIERIVSLNSDLVICNPSEMAKRKFAALGIELAEIPDETLDDVAASFTRIGELVGKPEDGRALSARLISAVEAARERTKARGKVRALVVIGYEPLWVAGGAGFLNELLTAAGGSNAAGAVTKDFYAIDFERVIAAAPECIIDLTLEDAGDEKARAKVRRFWRRFDSIPAVACGRIEFIDSDLLTIPGPRLVDGLGKLEKALHGDCDEGGGE